MTDRSHMTSLAGDMVKKSTMTKWGGLLWALCTDPGVGIPVPADRGWGSPVGRPILVGAFNPEGRGKLIWKIKTNIKNFTLRYMKNLILLIIQESFCKKNNIKMHTKTPNLKQKSTDHTRLQLGVLCWKRKFNQYSLTHLSKNK